MVDLDIVIPVYNEGDNILQLFQLLERNVKTHFCVLICYDHDEDTTLDRIRKSPPIKVEYKFIKNLGRGPHSAIITGFQNSKAPYVLVLPADDDYNSNLIDVMVAEAQKGADIICASRFMKGGRMQGCPWLKACLVRTAAFALYHLAGLPTHDPTNGFRLFSRRVVDTIPIQSKRGFTFSLELLVKTHEKGWKIAEVPALWIERKVGKSRFRILSWASDYLRWFFYAFLVKYSPFRSRL